MGSRILIVLFYRLDSIGIDPPNKSVSFFSFFFVHCPFFDPDINWDLSPKPMTKFDLWRSHMLEFRFVTNALEYLFMTVGLLPLPFSFKSH